MVCNLTVSIIKKSKLTLLENFILGKVNIILQWEIIRFFLMMLRSLEYWPEDIKYGTKKKMQTKCFKLWG